MKQLRKIYYKFFKRYKILETRFVSYQEADMLMMATHHNQESERWELAKEEDGNTVFGKVYICRKIRITK